MTFTGFTEGCITRDESAFTLRERQTACYEIKREARDLALAVYDG